MNYAYECKICHRPGIARDEEKGSPVTPEHWMKIFLPMLTCNQCSDRRDKFNAATESIQKTCWRLFREKEYGTKETFDALKSKMKGLLTFATRRYAEVLAEYRNLQRPVWDEDFVWQLLDEPGKVDATLRAYRKGLKQIAQSTPQELCQPSP